MADMGKKLSVTWYILFILLIFIMCNARNPVTGRLAQIKLTIKAMIFLLAHGGDFAMSHDQAGTLSGKITFAKKETNRHAHGMTFIVSRYVYVTLSL